MNERRPYVTLCQVTRGREAEYADNPLAQWIREQLEERGWLKQDLAAELVRASKGRLAPAGAKGLVHRATSGHGIQGLNRELFAEVLGEEPPGVHDPDARWEGLRDHLEELAAKLADSMVEQKKMRGQIDRLQSRVRTLEAQSAPAAAAPKRPRRAAR